MPAGGSATLTLLVDIGTNGKETKTAWLPVQQQLVPLWRARVFGLVYKQLPVPSTVWEEAFYAIPSETESGCRICEARAYPDPCRFPEQACVSMEGYSLFVADVCRDKDLAYHHREKTVTYTACILF